MINENEIEELELLRKYQQFMNKEGLARIINLQTKYLKALEE